MTDEVQLDEVPAALYEVAQRVVPGWMQRVAVEACATSGVDPDTIGSELDRTVDDAAADALSRLETLLATDVDEQRATPLSLLRESTVPVVAVLREHGVDPSSSVAAPGGAHGEHALGPATWSDVDEELHGPGIAWGAWKAMTVLRRRRDEGRR